MFRTRQVGKRLLALMAALLCLLGLALPVQADETATEYEVRNTSLVHYGPYQSAMVIGRMEEGATLTILGETKDFYKIDCYDMAGYIAKSQVVMDKDGNATVHCRAGSEETVQNQYVPLTDALSIRKAVLSAANEQLGVPYQLGGTTPRGFDCSGFVRYVMTCNDFSLRRTVTQQLQDTVIISRECLQPGDLLFFDNLGGFTSHVGIYIGNNQMIHAGNAGIGFADLDIPYFANSYLCARRIINVAAPESAQLPSAAASVRLRMGSGLRTVN